MDEKRLPEAAQTNSYWCRKWLPRLEIFLAFLIIQSIPYAVPSPALEDNRIVLPGDGQVVVNFISTHAICTGDFGLQSPYEVLIFPNYLHFAGLRFPLPDQFTQGTELVFYLTPRDFCAGGPYLSTDPNRARVTHPDANTWIIAWEDYTDGDFNDLVVRIDFQPATVAFLDLPYDYRGSTFADESKDTKQRGKINAYFDHQYPTDGLSPNAPEFPNTVNFYGYDSSQIDPSPPYEIAYDGHDGVDYYLAYNTPALAAADGQVIFASEIALPCDVNRPSKTVKIRHPNGYETQYWHLDRFASGLKPGTKVARDTNQPIGYVGNTGCIAVSPGRDPATSGYHLHFMVKNPEGTQVDPYGWTPEQNAAWHKKTDPWEQYQAEHDGPDATSHYLWIHGLKAVALVHPTASTVITSTSGRVRAVIPPQAYGGPLRMELAETLQSAHMPGYRSLHTFSLVGYTVGDAPVVMLGVEITIDVRVSSGTARSLATRVDTTPTLQLWDAELSAWQGLPTTWDPLNGVSRAKSAQIGTFAVSMRECFVYLPVMFKHTH